MSNKWESPKIVKWGGPLLGGVLLYLGALFYPAIVIGIHFGHKSEGDFWIGVFAGAITLVVILLLKKGCKNGSAICAILLGGLYIICFLPLCQWLYYIDTAEYVTSLHNDFEQEPFRGFDWAWMFEWLWGALKTPSLWVSLSLVSIACLYRYHKNKQ